MVEKHAPRILIYDHLDNALGELSEADIFALQRTEEVNGENSLSISTTAHLKKGWRLLLCDAMGIWREYVVSSIDVSHERGAHAIGTYWCMWSCKYDLMGCVVQDRRPNGLAGIALEAALSATKRWAVGTVTLTTSNHCSFYWQSSWECLEELLELWGGEIYPTIEVDSSGVIFRKLNLYDKLGLQQARRRFDFGYDLVNVSRSVEAEPQYCRVIPRGKGEETETGGYGRRITIESVNNGKAYLADTAAENALRLPDGSGGYEYPTAVIIEEDIEDPTELKEWGLQQLPLYTAPQVSYNASIAQYAEAGIDALGVALGDAVDIVDPSFYPSDALRVSARVMKIVTDELDQSRTKLTIDNFEPDISRTLSGMNDRLNKATRAIRSMNGGTLSTDEYLSSLIERLNSEINATGGYTYIVPGQGILTYDTEVTDPAIGTEATQVVEIRGGSVRIANSKTAQGDWIWRTVFVSGHIAAEMVTAAQITAGFIGSPSGNYWNLDTGELTMISTTQVGDTTLGGIVDLANTASSTAANANQNASNAVTVATEAKKQEVGGTNLLIDSNWSSLDKRAATANRYFTGASDVTKSLVSLTAANKPIGGTEYAFQSVFKASQSGKNAGICYYKNAATKMMDGQKYTISCWAKRTGGAASIFFQYGQTSYKASAKNVLSTTWKRYSWTFTFSQSAAGGSNGARIYFYALATSTTAATVQIAGMKLEIGDKATDWSMSPEDTNYGYTNAEALAKEYTNAISKLDREYTNKQRQALDNSLDQGKIFNRLTNNGKSKGIVLKNGQLYINGSYIQTDTLKADVIKAGILADKAGKNRWNLTTGYFYTKNGELENCNVKGQFTSGSGCKAQFNNGTVRFFNGNKNALTIDGSLKFADGNYGAHVTFPRYLVLRGPDLAVDDSTTGRGTIGDTHKIRLNIPTVTGGSAQNTSTSKWPKLNPGNWDPYHPKWVTLELSFINGICTMALLN